MNKVPQFIFELELLKIIIQYIAIYIQKLILTTLFFNETNYAYFALIYCQNRTIISASIYTLKTFSVRVAQPIKKFNSCHRPAQQVIAKNMVTRLPFRTTVHRQLQLIVHKTG